MGRTAKFEGYVGRSIKDQFGIFRNLFLTMSLGRVGSDYSYTDNIDATPIILVSGKTEILLIIGL